ncbi:MAG: hypothetical protein IJF71_01410 [Clostridia bacterium]|nr:hypothetical protein [Clostridia bacterium]
MKYEIIGWTEYDNYHFEVGENSYAVINVLIDEIKRNGYSFTGRHHQESAFCAPVFNDGKLRKFSATDFGAIMAEAYGFRGKYDYSRYAFCTSNPKDPIYVRPTQKVDKNKIVEAEMLVEEYTVEATAQQCQDAQNGTVVIADAPELRFIDAGDRLILRSKSGEQRYKIREIEKEKDLPEEQINEYMYIAYMTLSKEQQKVVEERYLNAPTLLRLTVDRIG